jgi:hypothetical protein
VIDKTKNRPNFVLQSNGQEKQSHEKRANFAEGLPPFKKALKTRLDLPRNR